MLSGRGLCDGLITRPEESYRMWCVVVCDLETSSRMRRSWPALGCSAMGGGDYTRGRPDDMMSLKKLCNKIPRNKGHECANHKIFIAVE